MLAHTAKRVARRRRADDPRGLDPRAGVFTRLRCGRFASERERDFEHTLRGYDDELHALDATEREKRIGDIATELFELRKAREESPSSEAEVVSAEFDVLFESHEKMAIDIAGQSLVVEKKQLSTWRFLSPLDEPEWRVCKMAWHAGRLGTRELAGVHIAHRGERSVAILEEDIAATDDRSSSSALASSAVDARCRRFHNARRADRRRIEQRGRPLPERAQSAVPLRRVQEGPQRAGHQVQQSGLALREYATATFAIASPAA